MAFSGLLTGFGVNFSYNDIGPLRSLNSIFGKKETSSYLDPPEQDVHFTEM